MKIEISPSSGFDNSYYDVSFKVTFSQMSSSDFTLRLKNQTSGDFLNVLATSSGYIDDNGIVFSPPVKSISGFFNLFNDDKMNRRLEDYHQIEIECEVEIGDTKSHCSCFFYNESHSVDRDIFPFSAKLEKNVVDMGSGQPLRLLLKSDSEKSVHLSIDAQSKNASYDFYVWLNGSEQIIDIPLEVLNYQLNLYKLKNEKFHLCYLKRHGVNYYNVVNEKRIVVPDTSFSFAGDFCLLPQTRFDPVGRELSYEEYSLSDRYFVPVPKEYSFFSRKVPAINKSVYDATFRDEIVTLSRKTGKDVIGNSFWRSEDLRPVSKKEDKNDAFYRTMNRVFINESASTSAEKIKSSAVVSSVKTGEKGCADCERKRIAKNQQKQL